MKVKAIRLGYYALSRRRPGEVFHLESEKHFSKRWMQKLEDEVDPKKSKNKKADVDEVPTGSASVI